MTNRLTVLAAALFAALGCAARPHFTAPIEDPTLARGVVEFKTNATPYFIDATVMASNLTAVTVMTWAKVSAAELANGVSGYCSFADARPHSLPDLRGEGAYDIPLVFEDGEWTAENLLPAWEARGCPFYTNGCYTVNIETDVDLTLTVGETEREVSAAAGMQQFVIIADSPDRDVYISHEATAAVVKFGIAEHHPVQFVGAATQSQADTNRVDLGGLDTDWRLFVMTGEITDGGTTGAVHIAAYDANGQRHTVSTNGSHYAIHEPRGTFAVGSRFQMSGILISNADVPRFWTFAPHVRPYAVSAEEIQSIIRRDLVEMDRRGIRYLNVDANAARLAVVLEPTAVTESSMVYEGDYVRAFAEQTIRGTNGIVYLEKESYSTNSLTIADLEIVTSAGAAVNGIDFVAVSNGNYSLTGFSKSGAVVTGGVAVTGMSGFSTNFYHFADAAYDVDYAELLSAAVDRGLRTNANCGVFRSWDFIRHIPCLPSESYATGSSVRVSTGWTHPHAISAHCYATAAHAPWTSGSATYGGVRCSWSAADSVSLHDWALTNGWTEATLPVGVDDIRVGRFSSGEVPAANRPYFAPTSWFANRGSIGGFVHSQLGMDLPVVMSADDTDRISYSRNIDYWAVTNATSAFYTSSPAVAAAIAARSPWLMAGGWSGDSGFPRGFWIDSSRFVLIGNSRSYGLGSSYAKWLTILTAYVAAQGDTILTIN